MAWLGSDRWLGSQCSAQLASAPLGRVLRLGNPYSFRQHYRIVTLVNHWHTVKLVHFGDFMWNGAQARSKSLLQIPHGKLSVQYGTISAEASRVQLCPGLNKCRGPTGLSATDEWAQRAQMNGRHGIQVSPDFQLFHWIYRISLYVLRFLLICSNFFRFASISFDFYRFPAISGAFL